MARVSANLSNNLYHRHSRSLRRRPAGSRPRPRSISSTVTTLIVRSAASRVCAQASTCASGASFMNAETMMVSAMITTSQLAAASRDAWATATRRRRPRRSCPAAPARCSPREDLQRRPRWRGPQPRRIVHSWPRDRAAGRAFSCRIVSELIRLLLLLLLLIAPYSPDRNAKGRWSRGVGEIERARLEKEARLCSRGVRL